MDRRTFLGRLTAATVLSRNLAWAAAQHKARPIGVQLYTVRDEMEKDIDGTLAKIAAIGYKNVELAGFSMGQSATDEGKIQYFKRSPQELRAAFDRYGLSVISAHVNYKSLSPENFPAVIEASRVLGQTYIINPSVDDEIRKQPDGWKRIAAVLNQAGEMSKKSGIQFGYHNHRFEFAGRKAKSPYDILLEECDPNLVKMEMDLCWIIVAGGDPVKYFERYPGRFPLVHVKDMKKLPPVPAPGAPDPDPLDDMTDVGSGVIDWKRIFTHSKTAGIKYYIVEHDKPKAPFDSIKASYDYLEKLRF
jgi:sugar phosphate isomerase/epimerase